MRKTCVVSKRLVTKAIHSFPVYTRRRFFVLILGMILLPSLIRYSGQELRIPSKSPPVAGVPSSRIQILVSQPWNDSAFAQAIAIVTDRREPPESRATATELLHQNRAKLEPNEIRRFLDEATALAKDATADESLSTVALRAMGNTALAMQELGQLTVAEAQREAGFLISAATDPRRGVDFRGNAIYVLGLLRIAESAPLLRKLLSSNDSLNVPEISRPSCLSLMRLEGERAIPELAEVLRGTADSRVFGTAAFALAQIEKPESILVLVENSQRFPENAACDAALFDLEGPIVTILENPQHRNLGHAIRATRHLW